MKIATIQVEERAYVVLRLGKRLDQGGDGVQWSTFWQRGPLDKLCKDDSCEQLQHDLFAGMLTSYMVELTKDGERFFRYEERKVSDQLCQTRTIVYVKANRGKPQKGR